MPDFLLTVGAEADLVEIAIYTVDTWGVEQARKYEHALTRHFRELTDGAIRTKAALTGGARPAFSTYAGVRHKRYAGWRLSAFI